MKGSLFALACGVGILLAGSLSVAEAAGVVHHDESRPAIRPLLIVHGCQYPHGWNETDFIRDINGIPSGIHHQCIDRTPSYRD